MNFRDRTFAHNQLKNGKGTYTNNSCTVHIGTEYAIIEKANEVIFVDLGENEVFVKDCQINLIQTVDTEIYIASHEEIEGIFEYFGITRERLGSYDIYQTGKYTYFVQRENTKNWFRKPRKY